ncbi:hypothetical protein OROGR_028900 [Orobanche gracilis]
MGSAGEEPYKVLDGTVGSLVWVRRRNGSWWPGRILSPNDLPEGCLPTPRSGTPVKLLGRADASVDWYNLDKSKRVKAFRCGEYNDCIEKAKASVSHLSKKAVKYARREDAILHALELENARLGKDFRDSSTGHNTQDNKQRQESKSPLSEQSEDVTKQNSSISEKDSESAPELSQSVVSFEEPKKCLDEIKEECKRKMTPNDSEDDGAEGVKRMRGLEDLGMGIGSSRRKRSLVGHVYDYSKKKNRRRTLSKVLECTPMVCVPIDSGQMSSPTVLESNEFNRLNCLVVPNNNNSDSTNGVPCGNGISLVVCRDGDDASLGLKGKGNEISNVVGVCEGGSCERLFDVPLVTEEKQQSAGVSTTVSGPSQKTQVGAGPHSSQSSHIETRSLANEEPYETGSTSSGTVDVYHNIVLAIGKGTSEWQLKGKRNSRPRKIDINHELETHVDRDNLVLRSNRVGGPLISDVDGSNLKSKPIKENQVDEFRGWRWNARGLKTDVMSPQRLLPYRQSRFTVNPKYDSTDFSLSHQNNNGGAALYDVNVEIQTCYRRQHVPYISLMSKLNGRPVTGHPISIEVLDDGFYDGFEPECYSSSSELEYNNLSRFSEWRSHGRPQSKRRSSKSRTNGLLSKKIRRLSSLTGSQRQSQHEKKPVLEKLKGPSIACVPLKVVFSRINAALNNSVRPTPHLNTMSGT